MAGETGLHDAAVAVARVRAQVADRTAADPRGALAWRLGKAAAAGGRGDAGLAGRVPGAVRDPALLPGRRGAGTAARGQAAGPGAVVVHLDPGALQRHYRIVELFSGEGPGPARVRAGGLAADLPGEARRDAAALVVDGGADGRADSHGVRRDLPRWPAVRAVRGPHPVPDAGEDRERREQRSEEHTSELQSRENLVCRLLLEKKKKLNTNKN